MKYFALSSCAILLLGACTSSDSLDTKPVQMSDEGVVFEENVVPIPSPSRLEAQFIEIESFESEYVQPRNVTVWLPEGYLPFGGERYPVIYAHDGQNKFHPDHSYGGVEWGLDETAHHMMQAGEVRKAIIVGIWNTDRRWQEYAPQKVMEQVDTSSGSEWLGEAMPDLQADAYLKFITQELKPYIDSTYQTAPEQKDTFIMGSSMGGLISLYAAAEYPDVFGRVGAVSIHWPLAEPDGPIAAQATGAMQAYLATSDLDMTRQKLWFDNGTETLDAYYPPFSAAMEIWFREQGWSENTAQFHTYDGTNHSETAWAERVDEILTFLLSED